MTSRDLRRELNNGTDPLVRVGPGIWDVRDCTRDAPLRLIGEGPSVTIFRSSLPDRRAFRQTGKSLYVSGIKFENYERAIELQLIAGEEVTLDDCGFSQCRTAIYGGHDKERNVRCDHIRMQNLWIHDISGRAIDLSLPFDSCVVRDSILSKIAGQGAIWLGASKYGIDQYLQASVHRCHITHVHAEVNCKALMIAAIDGAALSNYFRDVGVTVGAKHASDTCSIYYKCKRAIASGNTLVDACGLVAKEDTNLIASGNQLSSTVVVDRTSRTRRSVVGITTTANASVLASNNRLDGMYIGLASLRRSHVHHNTFVKVPLVRQYDIIVPAAIVFKYAVENFHEIHDNWVETGVFPFYCEKP